jgi:hypothetical protein
MDTSELLSAIDSELARLREVRALLGKDAPFPFRTNHAKKRHKMSAAGRAAIAAAQRKRWAKQKRAAKNAA